MVEPDDDALMQRIKAKDEAAFNQLLTRHLPAVHRYLTRMTGCTSDSDELSQETFLRVWENAERYRSRQVRFTTWLHRIAHNLFIDAVRRGQPGPSEESLLAEDPGPGPERRAELAQQHRILQQALMRLPEAQRSALLLCQVQGFSNREAAAIMNIGERALESLLARGRRGLRGRLDPANPTQALPQQDTGAEPRGTGT